MFKRGLIIGKFLPIHKGHIALINFAAAQCEELIVSMSYTPNDPIDPAMRFSWIKDIFSDQKGIKPEMVEDNFDDESLPWEERTKIWASFIKKRFPPVDVLFTSEEYGDPFARNLGIEHISFDPSRNRVPVSATLIRERPFQFWNFIPEIVRPYFVKKICFYGPESTGKSTLARQMADHFQTEFVPEVARELITSNDFTVEDIIRIGNAQTQRIQEKIKTANKILFCDTDLITTQIYSKIYLNQVPDVLAELEKKVKYDLYFLFDIDTPWVADGLRDLGNRREEMYGTFKNALEQRGINFIKISGPWQDRQKKIMRHIRSAFLL
jgi:HTH-type transcriptional repressor of NAD biosynthesis genes